MSISGPLLQEGNGLRARPKGHSGESFEASPDLSLDCLLVVGVAGCLSGKSAVTASG